MSSIVIEEIVKKDMCIGCGICVTSCDSRFLTMSYDEKIGIQIPTLADDCDEDGNCIKVCPFNPKPETKVETEDNIINELDLNSDKHNVVFGGFESIYAGYSTQYRNTSSSGGIATWLLNEMLNKDIVDAVVVVQNSKTTNSLYEYKLIEDSSGLLDSSKTKYYPINLTEIVEVIKNQKGRIALTGIPCFLKAIRLKQIYDVEFKDKIKFTIGIFCGGLKLVILQNIFPLNVGWKKRIFQNHNIELKMKIVVLQIILMV